MHRHQHKKKINKEGKATKAQIFQTCYINTYVYDRILKSQMSATISLLG
jgi:hypothetical protein